VARSIPDDMLSPPAVKARTSLLNYFLKPFPRFHGRGTQHVIRDGSRHTRASSNKSLQVPFGKQLLEST